MQRHGMSSDPRCYAMVYVIVCYSIIVYDSTVDDIMLCVYIYIYIHVYVYIYNIYYPSTRDAAGRGLPPPAGAGGGST